MAGGITGINASAPMKSAAAKPVERLSTRGAGDIILSGKGAAAARKAYFPVANNRDLRNSIKDFIKSRAVDFYA